jgi:hypothetical protein
MPEITMPKLSDTMKTACASRRKIRGPHAPRVLVSATRQDGLFLESSRDATAAEQASQELAPRMIFIFDFPLI